MEEIPDLLLGFITALNSKNRRKVIMCLIKIGPSTFTEIREAIGARSNELSAWLKMLQCYGVVSHNLAGKYSISPTAEIIIKHLYDSYMEIGENIRRALYHDSNHAPVT